MYPTLYGVIGADVLSANPLNIILFKLHTINECSLSVSPSPFSYQRHKSMFMFFIILTAVSFFTIQFIPTIPKSTQIDFHCDHASEALKFCPSKLDHCAADLFVDKANKNQSNEYTFDVSAMILRLWMLFKWKWFYLSIDMLIVLFVISHSSNAP